MSNVKSKYSLLTQTLLSLGKIVKPKKDNAKGVIVYNPQPFDLSTLEDMATNLGMIVIHKEQPSRFFDESTKAYKDVPPSLFVGVSACLDEDETNALFASVND